MGSIIAHANAIMMKKKLAFCIPHSLDSSWLHIREFIFRFLFFYIFKASLLSLIVVLQYKCNRLFTYYARCTLHQFNNWMHRFTYFDFAKRLKIYFLLLSSVYVLELLRSKVSLM